LLIIDEVNLVATATRDHRQRGSLDHKIRGTAAGTGNTAISIAKVNDVTVTDIHDVMLKWHSQVPTPDKEMIAFGHRLSLCLDTPVGQRQVRLATPQRHPGEA
jgi:hypothetical protein